MVKNIIKNKESENKIKKINKKAVSPVIATVLLIVITISVFLIVWGFTRSSFMNKTSIEQACEGADFFIDSSSVNTCYDSVKHAVSLEINKGNNEKIFPKLQLTFDFSNGQKQNFQEATIEQGYKKVYYFDVSDFEELGEVKKVSLAPITDAGDICEAIPSIDIKACKIPNYVDLTIANEGWACSSNADCSSGQICSRGACVHSGGGSSGPGSCTPNCAGRQCGTNGCDGSCGSCGVGQSCNASGQCVPPKEVSAICSQEQPNSVFSGDGYNTTYNIEWCGLNYGGGISESGIISASCNSPSIYSDGDWNSYSDCNVIQLFSGGSYSLDYEIPEYAKREGTFFKIKMGYPPLEDDSPSGNYIPNTNIPNEEEWSYEGYYSIPLDCWSNLEGTNLKLVVNFNTENGINSAGLSCVSNEITRLIPIAKTDISSFSGFPKERFRIYEDKMFWNVSRLPIPCIPSAELCNGKDEDCDTQIDEDFNFETDRLNCGRCGNVCLVDQKCEGRTCMDLITTFAPLKDVGEACNENKDCKSGLECSYGFCSELT